MAAFGIPIALGEKGVLAPGKWRSARALGWMVTLFVGLAAVLAGVQFGLSALFGKAGWARPIATIFGLAVMYGLYVAAVRFGEKRWPNELSLRHAPVELVTAVLSTILASAAFAIGQHVRGQFGGGPSVE